LAFVTAYADGALVTYAGELYKADSTNGSYIVEGQATSTSKFVKADVSTLLGLKANSADLATVATSGSYADLSNTPTIDATPTSASTNAVQSGGVYAALEGKVTEGSGYAVINGTRVYVSSTTPTGTIPEGSLGIGF
jgi:hypothetical protein